MASARVLVGGTFACDDAIARPLTTLLREASHRDRSAPTVDVEWLSYGAAGDLASLDEPLRRARVDLVVLLVRLSDLHAAHPELRSAATETITSAVEVIESPFLAQLRAYDAGREMATPPPPLVVVFCPSPPACHPYQAAQEAALCRAIQALQHVSCRPSSDALAFFSPDTVHTEWYNATSDKREHAPFTRSMLRVLALSCVRQIARLWLRSPKKVIVLDCDNTLWGGAVADVGPEHVELSERFLALQRFVVTQQQRGVLLCLCSKNIAADVDAVFRVRADEMVLSQATHVVLSKANWRAKSHNIQEIAQQLQLGLDAFVFVDDNAVECHEVASALPAVSVVRVPDDFDEQFLATQWAFDTPLDVRPTAEDSERTKLYQQNAQRDEQARRAASPAAFLSSLGIRIQCERLTGTEPSTSAAAAFSRVLQLHKRTNTFNVATTFSRALTSETLATYVATPTNTGRFALASTVTDRHGHYGLVCASLFHVEDAGVDVDMVVDSFLMSCRSLNRGVEHAMLKAIAEIARDQGAATIRVAWEPTVRNEPVRMFFATLTCTTFVSSESVAATTRVDKISQSASVSGWWRVATRDALAISFLREQEAQDQRRQAKMEDTALVAPWYGRLQGNAMRTVMTVVRFVLRWVPHQWLVRLIAWFYKWRRARDGTERHVRGITSMSFHTRAALDTFVDTRTDKTPSMADRRLGSDPEGGVRTSLDDDETDEAFRLRVRHETKLLLLDHVAADAPRVVWAPQRSDDVRLDVDDDDALEETGHTPTSDALQQFHRPCATPTCSARVYWESACAFQRCRTCCYRVQRLLARATSDRVHEKARVHACTSLADDWNVSMSVDAMQEQAKDEWCRAHTNDRRRQ